MGKNIVTLIFLIISGLASYLFITRESEELREKVSVRTKKPRITLENFTLHRYRDHKIVSTLTGQMANFMDPNLLEMYGKLRGLRYDSANREYFSAESASIYFTSNGVVQLLSSSEIARADIENDVNVGSQDKLIKSQYAQYLADKDILRSDVPVVLIAPDSVLRGLKGFEYKIDSEDIELFGPIEGTLQSDKTP